MSINRERERPRPPMPTEPENLTSYENSLWRDSQRRTRIIDAVHALVFVVVILTSIAGFVAFAIDVHDRRVACEHRGGLLVPDPDSWMYGMICVRAARLP